jgi:PAS domain S-box-containing protein
MNADQTEKTPSAGPEDPLADFHQDLQELVIDQARRLINLSFYNKALLSTLPVALLGTDRQGHIRAVNQAAEEILGVSEKEVKGTPLASLFAADSDTVKKIDHTLESGTPHHIGSESLRLKSGKEIVGNLYFQPLRDDEQQICGILLTVEDLTYFHYLHNAFKRYVPPSVSEIIAQDPQRLELGGEEKVLTVLFSDLIGFSAISERHAPREMVALLSDYFTEMTNQVFAYQGTLKEYVGDELMAIFGAPVAQPDHPAKACSAALAMSATLARMRETWPRMGRPVLRARTGINTGPMLVGNLGSPFRFSYGVVGDQVNLASRLEGLSNIYGTEILIGHNTAEAVHRQFRLREVDTVRVKGRQQGISIFELVATAEAPITGQRQTTLGYYADGLAAYRARRWKSGISAFDKALAAGPEDGPSKVMRHRCRVYRESPPPEDWNGVFDHKTKK